MHCPAELPASVGTDINLISHHGAKCWISALTA
uniref:Uncharacterized protein n=1 Tax=Anguilla anguilla TaxID=7936 RepID=A0A0E9URN3_ANGAN